MVNLFSERLLLTLWVGSLCAIGYVAVPIAFATLGDVALAGDYAGKLFSTVNLLGLGCGIALLLSKFISSGKQVFTLWRFWVLILMLTLTLVFSVYLQPEMASIKPLISQDGALIERFGDLHIIRKNLYLFITLLGLALVVSTDKVEA